MTALPAATDFTGAGVTEAQFKVALTGLRNFLDGLLGDTGSQIEAPDGTVSAPGIAFAGDLDTGFYRIGANNFGAAANGAKVLDIGTSGLGVTGSLTPTSLLDLSGAAAGQAKFPSTQNPSADANTLDDYREGTYSGTPTGFTVNTAQTVTFVKVGNKVTLTWDAFTGTSNATTFTVTGAPTSIRPSATRYFMVRVIDNSGSQAAAYATMDTGGTITFYKDLAGNAFTSSGSKAAYPVTVSYLI